jgi:spore coat polysaccharide biosynthesis protein SpsF
MMAHRRTVAVIQARMGSTRLAGKVLLPLLGSPILEHVVDRTGRATAVDSVVVATTTLPEDDVIGDLAVRRGWALTRGSATDLVDRYVQAAREHRAEVVVRITSDCPLIDPDLVDATIAAFDEASADYASNTLEPRTYPRGLDVEVVDRAALETAWREDRDPAWREHATLYLYRHPERFRLQRVAADGDWSGHRWTVDTPEDYDLVRRIYEAFGTNTFGWLEALAVVEAHPDWTALNASVAQKHVPA